MVHWKQFNPVANKFNTEPQQPFHQLVVWQCNCRSTQTHWHTSVSATTGIGDLHSRQLRFCLDSMQKHKYSLMLSNTCCLFPFSCPIWIFVFWCVRHHQAHQQWLNDWGVCFHSRTSCSCHRLGCDWVGIKNIFEPKASLTFYLFYWASQGAHSSKVIKWQWLVALTGLKSLCVNVL